MSTPAEELAARLAPAEAVAVWVFEGGTFRSDLSRGTGSVPGASVSGDGNWSIALEAGRKAGPLALLELGGSGAANHVVELADGAELEILHLVASDGASKVESGIRAHLARGSQFTHSSVVLGGGQEGSVGFQARLERDSRLTTRRFLLQGKSWEAPISVDLAGPGADAVISGLVAVDGDRTASVDAQVRHSAPQATSRQVFQALAGGGSKAAFVGKVVVDPGAKGTNARQSSRNILLSRDASIDSRPQLEIREDDVKCSHGSTTGRLDENALRFLRARGFSPEGARSLLVRAFAGEQVESLPDGSFRELVESLLEGLG